MAIQLIDDLGGVKAVATALGVNSNVVANWKLDGRGIPWKRRHALAKIAAERGIALPSDFWADAA